MTAGLGYFPAGSQPPLTPRTKFVDEAPKRLGFSGLDVSRLGHLGDGLARHALRMEFAGAIALSAESAKADRIADRIPSAHWQAKAAIARKAAAAASDAVAALFADDAGGRDASAPMSLEAALAAERAEAARLAAEEVAELDAEHLAPERLAEHLPPELAPFLERMPLPRRREREEAILRKVGWRNVGLIGLDPVALATLAENEASRYAKAFPCQDEAGNAINMEPDHRRRRTDSWWRKRLRRDQSRALLYVEAAVGAVGGPNVPGRPLYTSDYGLALHRQHEQRTREILSDLWLVREDDPSIRVSMLDVDASSRARKAAERRMLIDVMLHRWQALGWHVCWLTITLPGQYVCHSTNEGRRATEWDPELGPLEAMDAIQDDFHGVMALLRARGIHPQGWWNAQPQQSGTPHRHILIAVPTITDARAVCDAFRARFSTRKNDEDGPDRGCDASVIGDDHPDYRRRKGKDGKEETPRSAAMYAARYATRLEKPKDGGEDGEGEDGRAGGDEQARFEAWKRARRARTHTWLGLDAQRSPIELWRTLWANALRSDYEPDDARMALALRHMRSAQAFIGVAMAARDTAKQGRVENEAATSVPAYSTIDNAARGAWAAALTDWETERPFVPAARPLPVTDDAWRNALYAEAAAERDDPDAMAKRAADNAAREAWHAAIAMGLWPDADLDPAELAWLHGETQEWADPLPPMPLREERESVFGETRKVIVGAVGVAERFRLSGRPTRAELYEAAESVGIEVERPRAKLRRWHVLDSLLAAGIPTTWRLKKLSLAELLEHAELVGVTVHVPTVAPRAGEAVRALKEAGFGFSKRPDGSIAGFDLSGEILLRCEHRWKILSTEEALAAAVEAEEKERQKVGEVENLSDSPTYPRYGAVPHDPWDEGPPG